MKRCARIVGALRKNGNSITRPKIGNKNIDKHKVSNNTNQLSKAVYLVKLNFEDKLITSKIVKQ